jgi:hypothetical protein
MRCRFWDVERRVWSSEGVTSVLSADRTSITCLTFHLTTFGGVLSVPTSTEELLEELRNAISFNTFTKLNYIIIIKIKRCIHFD